MDFKPGQYHSKLFNVRSIVAFLATCFVLAASASPGPGKPPAGDILTEEEIADLKFMREEEKLARDSYLVLHELWGNPIFENIAASEQRHTDAIKSLLRQFDIEDPVVDESVIGDFEDHELNELFEYLMALGEQSETNALIVGALIEETDIEDIEHAISRAHNEDIETTYESLLCGSRNHLRAFVGQLESIGVIYQPTVIGEDVFLDIVTSGVERDCGTDSEDRRGRF